MKNNITYWIDNDLYIHTNDGKTIIRHYNNRRQLVKITEENIDGTIYTIDYGHDGYGYLSYYRNNHGDVCKYCGKPSIHRITVAKRYRFY